MQKFLNVYLQNILYDKLGYSLLTICRPLSPSLQKWSCWNKRWAMCWNLYKTTFRFLQFLFFEIWSILYSISLENRPKCHLKWPNYWVFLRFCLRLDQNAFQKILWKWKKVSLKKHFVKKMFDIFFLGNFFLLNVFCNVWKKLSSKWVQQKNMSEGHP